MSIAHRRQHFWCLFKLQGAPSARSFDLHQHATVATLGRRILRRTVLRVCRRAGRSGQPPARAAGGLQSIKRQRFSCRRFSQPDAFATTISIDRPSSFRVHAAVAPLSQHPRSLGTVATTSSPSNASRACGGGGKAGRRGHSVCLLDRSLARSRRSQLYPPRAHVRTCTGVRSPAPTLSRCGQRERTSSPSNASRARGGGRQAAAAVSRPVGTHSARSGSFMLFSIDRLPSVRSRTRTSTRTGCREHVRRPRHPALHRSARRRHRTRATTTTRRCLQTTTRGQCEEPH